MTDDHRLYAPAAARNRDPIRDVLMDVLPSSGLVLEVASGSGEHAIHLATAFPHLVFQPSDPSETARRSIAAWIAGTGLGNLRPPIDLDARLSGDETTGDQAPHAEATGAETARVTWAIGAADALLCINMIHISPWQATIGLIRQAAAILPAGAPLYLYGPYKRGGQHTAPSNAAFDAGLRSQNDAWGVRDLEAVAALAAEAGFSEPRVIEMPANNLSVIFRRLTAPAR
jgi:hypothetical protein